MSIRIQILFGEARVFFRDWVWEAAHEFSAMCEAFSPFHHSLRGGFNRFPPFAIQGGLP